MHRVWGLLCKDKTIQDRYHSASRQTARALLLSSRHSYCARNGPHKTRNELITRKPDYLGKSFWIDDLQVRKWEMARRRIQKHMRRQLLHDYRRVSTRGPENRCLTSPLSNGFDLSCIRSISEPQFPSSTEWDSCCDRCNHSRGG